ncbi:MerR family transcriptional regulator [Cohnella hashimotonis]|uniref:MerR family transcriptional regulator n=1 Tax=Cohnella hashimotonis TaxID=2826895 RepID=A0ABT6T9L5_9BACL|nr:MerR family transcriptional regulator [Cohnella hashimotonis]MDI4643522.1 MerR family transcriptional regulator [Cohnella hashimotonis]
MKKKFKIGELAKIKNIDTQTLRYYDQIGVLSPELTDPLNGYRYYSEEQFVEVDHIKFLKLLGLSLEEAKQFKEITSLSEAMDKLKTQQKLFEKRIAQMQTVAQRLSLILDTIEEKSRPLENAERAPEIEIRDCGSIRGVIGDCQTVQDWFDFEAKLQELVARYPNYSEIGHNHGHIYIYNEEYFHTADDRHIEKVILPLERQFRGDGIGDYPLGVCIVAYHKGKIENLMQVFSEIKKFIADHRLTIRGDIVMTSIVSSFIVRNENEHLAEIRIPLI